jgi:transcriptional regulator with XRE-family HTH domain
VTITPAQCRAARALLGWTQVSLGRKAYLGESTIRDFEAGRRVPAKNNLGAMAAALEAAGVEFATGGEWAVKLRKVVK